MTETFCSILPNYLVRSYLEDTRTALNNLLENAPTTHGIAAGGSVSENQRQAELRSLIEKLERHLEFQHRIAVVESTAETGLHGFALEVNESEEIQAFGGPIPPIADQIIYTMENKVDVNFISDEERQKLGLRIGKLPGIELRPPYEKSAKEVYDFTQFVYKLYADLHSRNSLDNKGMKLVSSIHFGEEYANAFWTSNLKQMVYGDGNPKILKDITSHIEVIAHELTHGVVDTTCKLRYRDESGALNESIADIFGIMVKQLYQKTTFSDSDWLIGDGMLGWGGALRSFKNEKASTRDIQPKHVDDMQAMIADRRWEKTLDDDYGGVHIFSGIPNHAFYLFCQALGNDTLSYGLPGTIWYKTITSNKVKRNANFVDFGRVTVDVARDEGGDDLVTKLKGAWRAVGVIVNCK